MVPPALKEGDGIQQQGSNMQLSEAQSIMNKEDAGYIPKATAYG